VSDRARGIKERTLAMEVKHAQAMGGTFRDAETANMRNLERMEARKRLPKKIAAAVKPRGFAHREVTKKDLADAVQVLRALSRLQAPPAVAAHSAQGPRG
jgi:hypothetical protein